MQLQELIITANNSPAFSGTEIETTGVDPGSFEGIFSELLATVSGEEKAGGSGEQVAVAGGGETIPTFEAVLLLLSLLEGTADRDEPTEDASSEALEVLLELEEVVEGRLLGDGSGEAPPVTTPTENRTEPGGDDPPHRGGFHRISISPDGEGPDPGFGLSPDEKARLAEAVAALRAEIDREEDGTPGELRELLRDLTGAPEPESEPESEPVSGKGGALETERKPPAPHSETPVRPYPGESREKARDGDAVEGRSSHLGPLKDILPGGKRASPTTGMSRGAIPDPEGGAFSPPEGVEFPERFEPAGDLRPANGDPSADPTRDGPRQPSAVEVNPAGVGEAVSATYDRFGAAAGYLEVVPDSSDLSRGQIDPREVIEQIVTRMELNPERGEFEIRLEPEFLGRVETRLAMDDGLLTVRFLAEDQMVRDIVQSNLTQLRSELAARGFQDAEVSVGIGGGMDREDRRSGYFDEERRQHRHPGPDLEAVGLEEGLLERYMLGRIDYLT